MKKIMLMAAMVLAAGALNAQTYNQKLLAFETGKESEEEKASITSMNWKFSTDVWEISDDMNHTKDGKYALHYESDGPTEKTRVASSVKKMNHLITLEDGIFQAKLWVYVEEGTLHNFELKFPIVKIKDGKVLPSKSKETPDFESPLRIAKVKAEGVENGKWVQLTSGPFYLKDVKHIDKLKSCLSICYPKGQEEVEFYIDDITIVKKEIKK